MEKKGEKTKVTSIRNEKQKIVPKNPTDRK
jgi:hypothetical protein